MNTQYKTILMTVLTLSCFTIALVELSGVSSTALFNKYKIGNGGHEQHRKDEELRESTAAKMPKTTIQYIDTLWDFGKIKEGEIVTHGFRIKNTGSNPLLISKAVPSCGCTVPSVPKYPILPGDTAIIDISFDSHNREGHNHKNTLIYSNAEVSPWSVSFDVNVE